MNRSASPHVLTGRSAPLSSANFRASRARVGERATCSRRLCHAACEKADTRRVRLRMDGTVELSPSDLSAHLACAHLTTLDLRAARSEIVKPKPVSAHGDLIRRKGHEHEVAYLEALVAAARSIVRIPTYDDETFDPDDAA